jgi:uncharacterized protein (TIGR00730 family)
MTESRRRTKKAYLNEQFLLSSDARPLRMLAEYLEPESRLAHYHVNDTIVFMGSARFIAREQAERELATARAEGGDVARAEQRLVMSQYYEASRELAHKVTEWSKHLSDNERRFVVCTGGGPGIMEAANRGASEARGINVGLTISLPQEESDNPYITRELAFEFHYFFMRKFWFAYLAKAVIFFPGGFGTFDELFELLTLLQTRKIRKHMPIVLFGKSYWNDVVNFEALVRYGVINAEDRQLFHLTDSVDDAFAYVTGQLSKYADVERGAML